MNRREFLQAAALVTSGTIFRADSIAAPSPGTQPASREMSSPPNKLPRWRGFILLEMFNSDFPRDFAESDFAMIAGWGFDFVRIPASYLCWSSHADWSEMREKPLENLDRAVAFGKQHGVHVNINLHRLPGYCVNPPKEPASLWADPAALDAACHQWAGLARRFKGSPSWQVSFDLINEPADLAVDIYVKVITRLVAAIRAEDPNRLIVADGLKWGRSAVPELASLGIGQSTRGYMPLQISHYRASWMEGSEKWAVPTWPLVLEKETWDRQRLSDEQQPWRDLQASGVGVHVGEWGAFNHTPHEVVIRWMRDNLELWRANGWGWSLWNFTGAFGVLDSDRGDVSYESYNGHRLDREMLELLRSH